MSITQTDNRVTVTAPISEADQAYAWIRHNGYRVATTAVEGGQLTVTAKRKEGDNQP